MQVTKWDGKPITVPGWYSGIPIETYHSAGICDGVAVSSSNLRRCWTHSPAHMNAQWCENPDADPISPSRFMILGSAAHHLFLGEDGFTAKFIAQPAEYPDKKTGLKKPWHNGSDYCKAWNDKFSDRTIVTLKELQAIIEMAKSLAAASLVQKAC